MCTSQPSTQYPALRQAQEPVPVIINAGFRQARNPASQCPAPSTQCLNYLKFCFMDESGIRIVNSSLHQFISNKVTSYTSKFTTPQQPITQHPVPSTQYPVPLLHLNNKVIHIDQNIRRIIYIDFQGICFFCLWGEIVRIADLFPGTGL